MIKEKNYSINNELPGDDFYEAYTTSGININRAAMEELADCFVGFATAPVGVYNHKTFAIMAYKFNTIDEMKDAVRANRDANVEMVLYYISDDNDSVLIRMVEV